MENFKTIEKSQAENIACIMANLLSAEHKMSEIRSRGRVDIDRVVYDTARLEVAERTIELCEVHGIELPNYLESKAGLYQDQLILEESHRRERRKIEEAA